MKWEKEWEGQKGAEGVGGARRGVGEVRRRGTEMQ